MKQTYLTLGLLLLFSGMPGSPAQSILKQYGFVARPVNKGPVPGKIIFQQAKALSLQSDNGHSTNLKMSNKKGDVERAGSNNQAGIGGEQQGAENKPSQHFYQCREFL